MAILRIVEPEGQRAAILLDRVVLVIAIRAADAHKTVAHEHTQRPDAGIEIQVRSTGKDRQCDLGIAVHINGGAVRGGLHRAQINLKDQIQIRSG